MSLLAWGLLRPIYNNLSIYLKDRDNSISSDIITLRNPLKKDTCHSSDIKKRAPREVEFMGHPVALFRGHPVDEKNQSLSSLKVISPWSGASATPSGAP